MSIQISEMVWYDYDDREKPVDQASRLLDRMVDLKHQVANGRFDDQFNYGPYPLDPYLKTGRGSDVKTQPLQVNAPVYNNYSDVKKVLNTVNKKISQLESNLKHVTRFQNEDELSCLAKVLQGESEDLEQNKIKSMVDRLIKSKRKIIEDDVQRELLNAELKKQELIEASKKPSTKDLKKVAVGGRVTQTYQRKRETTRFTQDKDRSVTSRPYGKNLLPSNIARVGRSEPITSKVDSKTVYKTLITQTKQSSKTQQRQQPGYRQQQTVPVINNIMPMAVALCEPRYLPGRAAGVLSCEPMACSSPSSQTHPTSLPNLSNIQDTTFIDQINSPSLSPRSPSPKSPGYHSPTHSMVDNYSDVEGTGIILPGYQHEEYRQPPEPSRVVFKPPNLESYDQNPTSDVIANDIHRQNLLQEKASQWLESELMAQVLSQVNRGGEEKIHHESSWGTDNQYNYRDLVNKQPGVDQDSQLSDNSATQSESVEEDLQEKIQKIFISVGQPVNSKIVSTLVQEALIDRIRTLLGESQPSTSGTRPDKKTTDLEEVKDDYDDDFESVDSPEPSMKHLPTPDLTPMSSLTDSPVRQDSPPPPATKRSPVRSPKPRVPRRQKVEEIDDSDVYNSMMMTREPEPKQSPQQPVTVPSPDSDSDPSTSYDISQELRRLAVKPEEKADFIIQSVHDVETPVPTPPPRSPTPVQTLPQFIASPPPLVSVQHPTSVHHSITEEPSFHDVSRRQDPDATGTSFNFNRTGISVDNIQDVRKSTTIVRMSSTTVRDSIEVPQPQESPRPVPQPTVIHVGSPQAISPVRDPSLIPSPDQRSSPSTSITDTINECISEGQWLLNRSEGQVAEIPIDPVVIENIKYNRIDISTASTLRDTEDLDLDDLDNLKSEGEFIHYSSVPVQQDINSLLQRQQESYTRDHVDGPGYPTELNVTESMGELSLGQIQSSRVGQPRSFQTNGNTYASDVTEEEDSGPSKVIRVGESLPGTSQRNFSRPPLSQTGPQFSTYTRQSRDENGTSRDSTMNLEDLDISKRKLPPSRKWNDKPKTTTFSLSHDSMRSSGGLEMTESELGSERYGVRESQDSDRYRLGDTLDSDRYRLGESADSDRYKHHDLLDSDRYKFRKSMDSEMSAQTNEDESEEQDRKDPKGHSGPYRMSVTVPSVHPISEDEDSEEISEIDATISK
ncbi:hypothetical protein LOTGIDRAFT_234923 [Lottia gigantea]|uniref:Uncharacterized protein n=1 Tax=Lottia gigantea TaxID=225164 RepID=V3ZTG8_LOTGI|nr:hypothetical protein LOTGIDRAFT_234923 [Lottia gigantea]ESO87672.1 hypothetical protein LOTGIDRAFT_234923 [Lottia gigantea]